MVRGAPLAQAGDRGGEERRGGPVAVGGGQAGVGQVTFGPQHRGDLAGLVRVKQGEQLADGGRSCSSNQARAASGQAHRWSSPLIPMTPT